MKSIHCFAAALALCVGACNFTPEGQCYLRGDSEGAGVGGGVIASGAGPGGGFGDSPSTGSASIPCNASDNKGDNGNGASPDAGPVGFACNPGMVLSGSDGTVFSFCASGCNDPVCITFGSFSAAAFHFKVIVADDGKDEAGGWQEADENLKFVRWTQLITTA